MGWRYLAARLNGNATETFLDYDLPLTQVKMKDVLSGPLALSAVISPETPRLMTAEGYPILEPWSTAIYAEKDGLIRGGYIVKDVNVDEEQLSVDAIGFSGYPQGMPYTAQWTKVGVDPLDAFREIWRHTQSASRGNLGVTLGADGSAARLGDAQTPYQLAWFKTPDMGSELDSLALNAPFDYHEEHRWNGDTVAHSIRFGVPLLGRRRADLRFALGENIWPVPGVGWDGGDYASEVLILGAGEGAKMVRASASRTTTRLRRVVSVADKSLATTAAAASAASAELRSRLGVEDITEVAVTDHPNAPIGSWDVGDEILVDAGGGWMQNAGLWCRVLATTITPESPMQATLSLARVERIANV